VKLLQCRRCGDVVRIYTEPRCCHCGACTARYVSETHVKIDGPGRALGLDTGDVTFATGGWWHQSDRIVNEG
jgi:hypothetical protein